MPMLELEARFGDSHAATTINCQTIWLHDEEATTRTGADGSVQRSVTSPPYIAVEGLPADFNPRDNWNWLRCDELNIGWQPMRIRMKGATSADFLLA